MHPTFELDSLENSKALSLEVTNPGYEITYSKMSYGKGACIVRMMETMIKTGPFRAGIKAYLDRYAFGNANRNDLWTSLSDAAHQNGTLDENLEFADIMEGWAVQEGYPVIRVTENSDMSVTLTQRRFYLDPTAEPNDSKWWVPITVAYPGKEEDGFDNTYPSNWMMSSDSSIDINITSKPFLLNVQQTGYYRVNYSPDTWSDIASQLKTHKDMVHRLNRAQLVDDAFSLARAKQLTYYVAVDMAKYLVDETDYIPIKAALNNLEYLEKMYRDNADDHDIFRAFTVTLFSTRYDQLGFEATDGEVYEDALLRDCLLYTSPSPRDRQKSRMPSSA